VSGGEAARDKKEFSEGSRTVITVDLLYLTGFKRRAFSNARLAGDWNNWAEVQMNDVIADDGCPAFAVTVEFDDAQAGQVIRWGVRFDAPAGRTPGESVPRCKTPSRKNATVSSASPALAAAARSGTT
jgi:hypothetical protein